MIYDILPISENASRVDIPGSPCYAAVNRNRGHTQSEITPPKLPPRRSCTSVSVTSRRSSKNQANRSYQIVPCSPDKTQPMDPHLPPSVLLRRSSAPEPTSILRNKEKQQGELRNLIVRWSRLLSEQTTISESFGSITMSNYSIGSNDACTLCRANHTTCQGESSQSIVGNYHVLFRRVIAYRKRTTLRSTLHNQCNENIFSS